MAETVSGTRSVAGSTLPVGCLGGKAEGKRQDILDTDGLAVLLAGQPFRHQLHDADGLLGEIVMWRPHTFDVGDRAIFFNYKREGDSTLNATLVQDGRIAKVLLNELHQGSVPTGELGLLLNKDEYFRIPFFLLLDGSLRERVIVRNGFLPTSGAGQRQEKQR